MRIVWGNADFFCDYGDDIVGMAIAGGPKWKGWTALFIGDGR